MNENARLDDGEISVIPRTRTILTKSRVAYWKHPLSCTGANTVHAGDIYGLSNVKRAMGEFIAAINRWPEMKANGQRLPRGGILLGEQGNGKTLMLRHLITEVRAPVFRRTSGAAGKWRVGRERRRCAMEGGMPRGKTARRTDWLDLGRIRRARHDRPGNGWQGPNYRRS